MTPGRDGRARTPRAAPAPIAAVSALMVALGICIDVLWVAPRSHLDGTTAIWAGVLAAVFLLVELVPIHLEWAGQGYSMSLSETPLVMGLFFCPGMFFVAARVIGGAVALARGRKQPPHKLAFNVSLQYLEASLVLGMFLLLPHHASGSPMSAAPAALLSVLTSSFVGMAAVCVAVRISVGQLDHTVVLSFLRTGVFGIVVNASIAFVLTTALRASMSVAAPMIVMLMAAGAVYKAYVALRHKHSSLEMLYQFTSGLNQTTTTEHRIRDILQRTQGMLRADIAGLLIAGADGVEAPVMRWTTGDGVLHTEQYHPDDADWPFTRVMEHGDVLVIPRATREPDESAFLAARGFRDATIAPLRLDGHVRGVLFVADREGDIATFTPDDARLFQTVAVQVSSVLDNSRLLDRLTHDSLHDALTGLANRQCYQARLRKALGSPRAQVAVLLTDLDRFKEVNDTLGHHHGDLLIREIADRIAETAPAIATVARLGGDEFALLIPGMRAADARELAQRIRSAIAVPCTLDGVSVDVEASIGVAVAPDHGVDDSVLLKRADMAMYAAKSAHTGVELYDSERDEYSPRRLALASRLRSAIESDELVLHYQPQIAAKSGALVGVEALVRWNHPEYGLVPPNEFVPIAEQSGAIGDLTLWVLGTATSQLAEWREAGLEIDMSVNVSMRNLLDAAVAEAIARLVAVYQLPPGALTLEITETHIMSDPSRTLPVLHRLAGLGVRLSVDDFGTGYSSLSYLNELPVDEVKIDKSFVLNAGVNDGDGAIVRAIVSLGQNLGLETVAEGIETEEAARALAELGCTRLQGYWIARPMPAVDFWRWRAARELPQQAAAANAGTGLATS